MKHEVVAIGGGLAGSAAAIALARAGRDVLLVEREAGPHDKVCGEFLSIEAQHHLAGLGIDLHRLGAAPIDRIRLLGGRRDVAVSLPFHGLSLSRRVLDEALLEQAGAQGAKIRRGVAATSFWQQGDGWELRLSDGQAIIGDAVFIATGKHALRGIARPSATPYLGFRRHYRLAGQGTAREVAVLLFDGGYLGLEPSDGGEANLCLAVTKRRFQRAGSFDALLAELCAASSTLAKTLEGAEACEARPQAVAGVPYGFLHRPAPGDDPALYRLGDQCAVIPSFCGDGMAIALHSAQLAAEHFLAGDADSYHRAMHAELGGQMRLAGGLARLAASRPGRAALTTGLTWFPALLGLLARQTRLPGWRDHSAAG